VWEPRNTPNTRKQEETDCGLFLGGESRENGTFRTLQKHRENTQKFGSCPLRSKTLVFPGFFAFLANCFGFLCLSMHVHACRCCVVLCAALNPGESSSESPESSQNPRFSRENLLFCSGGAGFELGEFESY